MKKFRYKHTDKSYLKEKNDHKGSLSHLVYLNLHCLHHGTVFHCVDEPLIIIKATVTIIIIMYCLMRPGWPVTLNVAQAGLELGGTLLPLALQCCVYRCVPLHMALDS